jgi:inorganic pyrophosphatase/exopolyphosphatase
METGYFYSKSTGLYVAREPLKIDARVIKAASGCGIKLSWDDEGRINYISLDDGLLLLRKLGATMLTMKDYWLVLRDAKKAGDEDMARQLQSSNYAEWLNTTFEKEKTIQMPFGHPGWFNVEDVDYETGLPGKVELNREKYSASWKYWSFCGYDYVAAAVRGWVTSAGKPSLDLGIPANAVYPVLVIRECRRKPLHPSINQEILEEAERLVSLYEELTLDELYGRRKTFLQFFDKYGKQFQKSQEIKICQIREKMIEIRGILRLIAKSRGNAIVFQDFVDFAQSSRERLEAAVGSCKSIVFVMGHKNPDTDAVVSALAEAYRNHLLRGEEVTYIPVVQGKRVPDEIRRLLGERLSDYILLSDEIAYRKAAKSGQARWIMVDHNKDNEIQRFVVSIVDHHAPSEIALRQNTVKTLEMVGSTTALVVQKISGLGMDIPPALARILYGATLMDTENRSKLKMTAKDELIMGSLKEAAGVENDSEFYQDLMSRLLSTDDAELLFERDYKEDWAFFGFAVVKVKKLQKNLLRKLVRLARQNNKKKNLSLTIIKVVDYEDDNETINLERIYLIFNDGVFPEFKEVMFKLIEAIVNYTFKGLRTGCHRF